MPARRLTMTYRSTAKFAAVTSALALAATFGLTGCAAENATTSAEEEIMQEFEFNSGEDETFDDDGFSVNWADLPLGWPDGIPLLSEKIQDSNYAETPDGESWRVEIVADDLRTDIETARTHMVGAGFTEESWGESSDGPQAVFVSTTHRVVVTGTVGVWGEDVVRYEVTPL